MKNLLLLIITLLHFTVSAQTLEADRSSLVKFFNGTNGAQWTNKTNWNSDIISPCGWFGVTCANGRVTELNLFNNNLSGTIPIEKEDFTALKVLELARNTLSGTIPAELGNLSSLERLAISDNQLQGEIPPKLAYLQNLKELIFSGNHLSGTIPPALYNLKNLTTLNLSYNELSGSISSAIVRLSKLQGLYLESNYLEGPLPDSLGYLPDLRTMILHHNRITGSIPSSFSNLNMLYLLWLYDNKLSGTIPAELDNLLNLQYLDLHTNQLSGVIPASLGKLTNLLTLNLLQNLLTGSLPSELGNLKNLTSFHLGYNQLTGPIPASLGKLTNLSNLYLVQNLLTGSIPSELGNLKNLTTMNLGYNKLTGSIPETLGNMSLMENLHLSDNQLTGSLPASLGALSKLKVFYIYNNQLSGTIPDLSGIPASAILIFSSNKFTFDGIESNISKLDSYSNQALLPLSVNSKILSVNAGGTLSNNSYRWMKNYQQVELNKGFNTFTMNGDGNYHVEVYNDLVPSLILYSNMYSFSQAALPVTLVNFSAKKSGMGNLIFWTTSSETNNAGFEIERSADAQSFTTIAKIDGNKDSKFLNNYQFIDTTPFADSYYKLKQIDYDGTTTYSRQIFVESEISALKLYPNPSKGEFILESADSNSSVFVYDLQGRKVLEKKGASLNTIRTDQLAKGIYIIQVGSQRTKLLVEK